MTTKETNPKYATEAAFSDRVYIIEKPEPVKYGLLYQIPQEDQFPGLFVVTPAGVYELVLDAKVNHPNYGSLERYWIFAKTGRAPETVIMREHYLDGLVRNWQEVSEVPEFPGIEDVIDELKAQLENASEDALEPIQNRLIFARQEARALKDYRITPAYKNWFLEYNPVFVCGQWK